MIKDNHIQLYYEKIGHGPNLIMLHGNGEDHYNLLPLAESLAHDFTIYLIDSRGHGKSPGGIAKDYQEMGIDLIDFLNQHQIYQTHVFGYSDGAIVALKAAVMQPGKFDKLILCGMNVSPNGLVDESIREMREAYQKNKDPKLALMLEGPIFKPFDFDKVKHETLLYFGEFDLIKKSHQTEIAQLLKHATLRVLVNETHGSYIMNRAIIAPEVLSFLKDAKRS